MFGGIIIGFIGGIIVGVLYGKNISAKAAATVSDLAKKANEANQKVQSK